LLFNSHSFAFACVLIILIVSLYLKSFKINSLINDLTNDLSTLP